MKKITILILSLPVFAYSQTRNISIQAEVKDTTITAYNHYYGGFENKGFYLTKKMKKDSIGVNKVRITKLFYYKSSKTNTLGKRYLNHSEIEYLGKRIGNDYPIENY